MLADLIRGNKIGFHSYGRKLDKYPEDFVDKYPEDFGQYDCNLVNYLAGNSGNCMAIRGEGLEDYLKEMKNLYELTDFLVQLRTFKKFEKIYVNGFHVDADIEKINKHYKRPKEEPIYNGLCQKVCDAANWVPEIPYFEKLWNFALCSSIGGFVGYPGYEHPRDDASFRAEMRSHAANFMIGTKEQLKRYRRYAEEHLKNALNIAEIIKKDPDSAFKSYHSLRSMEDSISKARHIAENLRDFENM